MQKNYKYPNGVLINKFGVEDQKILNALERCLSSRRQYELAKMNQKFIPSLKMLQEIHGYLFQDIYEWAGQIREVDISKGIIFCLPPYIESESKKIFSEMEKEMPKMKKMGRHELSQRLAFYMGEINSIHPFREGNGRTQRFFMKCLANELGHTLEFTASKEAMISASRKAFMGDYGELAQMIEHGLDADIKKKKAYSNVERDFPEF